MEDTEFSYYTRLAPFRPLFAKGNPILTFHKFGPRPRWVRLRGMYLSIELFSRQLAELKGARYRTMPVGDCAGEPCPRQVALTIDDGFRSVHEHALPRLVQSGFQAILYLVVDRLGGWNDWEMRDGEIRAPLMDAVEIREWLAAGQRIGAHSLSHPWLTRLPISAVREEVGASRRKLEDLFGIEVLDFCYPYGDFNRRVRDEVAASGYRTATTTDFGVNRSGEDPFLLKRITVRHASRGWRGLRGWLTRWRRR